MIPHEAQVSGHFFIADEDRACPLDSKKTERAVCPVVGFYQTSGEIELETQLTLNSRRLRVEIRRGHWRENVRGGRAKWREKALVALTAVEVKLHRKSISRRILRPARPRLGPPWG